MAQSLSREIDITTKVNVEGEQDISKISKQMETLRDKIIELTEADKLETKETAFMLTQIDKLTNEYGKLGDVSIKPLLSQLEYLKTTILTINSDNEEFYNTYKKYSEGKIVKPDFDKQFFDEADRYFNKLDDDFLNLNNNTKNSGDLFNGIIRALKEFLTTGKLSQGTVENLAKSFGATIPQVAAVGVAFAACVKLLKEYNKAAEEVLSTMTDLGKDTVKFIGDLALGTGKLSGKLAGFSVDALVKGVEVASEAFGDLIELCKVAIEELNEFAELGEGVGNSLFGVYTYLGDEAGKDVLEYTNNLRDLFNLDPSQLYTGLRGILAVTSQLGGTKEQVSGVTEALEGLVTDIAAFSGESFDTLASQLENAINLGILNSRSAVAKALDLTDSDIKKYKELGTYVDRINFLMSKGSVIQGTYQRYMDSSVGKVTALKNAYADFMNTVGQLVLEIYAVIAPIVTQIINLATKAVEGLAKLFGFDLGSAQSSGAVDYAGKYADSLDNLGKSFDETGKQAEKASKKVASFDDVIQIDDDKNKNSSSLANDIGDLSKLDVSGWLKDFSKQADNVTTSLDKLKKQITDLLKRFKKFEEGLDWKKLRKDAQDFGKDMADLLNIVIDDEQAWHDLGDLMGNSLNTGLEFLNEFADTIHWGKLGSDIGEAWVTFWKTLDEDLAADTIASWFNGTVDAAIEFFGKKPITEFADSISRMIIGIIKNTDTDDIVTLIINILDDILDAINTTLDNFENSETTGKIVDMLQKIVKGVGERIPEITSTLTRIIIDSINLLDDLEPLFGDIIDGALDLINGILDNLDEEGASDKLAEVIGKIAKTLGEKLPEITSTLSRLIVAELNTLGDLITETLNNFFEGLSEDPEAIDKVVESIINIIDAVFENIGKIGEVLSSHKDQIKEIIKKVVDSAVANSETWAKDLQPLVDTLIDVIASLDWSKIGQIMDNIIRDGHIGKLASAIKGAEIKKELTEAWVKFKEFFDQVGDGIQRLSEAFDLLWGVVSTVIGFVAQTLAKLFGFSDETATQIGQTIGQVFNSVVGTIRDLVAIVFELLTGNLDKVEEYLDKIVGRWKTAWEDIKGWFTGLFDEIIGKVKEILEWVDLLKKGYNAVKEKGKDWWNSEDRWWNKNKKSTYQTNGFSVSVESPSSNLRTSNLQTNSISPTKLYSMPQLAIGGIVTGSTIANIGEDGTEAVLPLEKNTGWMDALASRMAALINNGGGSSNAPIQINLSDKSIYTRKEMLEFAEQVVVALRAYGINVSMAV